MTDEYLMLCVKNEDLNKAAILYERYKRKLYSFFLYRNCQDVQLSEDCVQQVFYRLIKYRSSYKEGTGFKTWLYSIAVNVHQHEYKQQLKLENARSIYPVDEVHTDRNDEYSSLHQALDLLSDAHRELLLMTKFIGLKYEEIAEINNCTVGVIKTRVFRAMKDLREIYFKIT